jgi:hypothetical protein
MTKSLMVSLVLGLAVSLGAASASADTAADQNLAALDAQARVEGQSFALRARALNERIARGWPQGSVQSVMGQPERVERTVQGADQVEIWGYAGFDVRVQFRNGFVENWFVRFAQ